MSAPAELVEPVLDLRLTPFSLPESRLFVLDGDRGLAVHTAEYERPAHECVVLDGLMVHDADGRLLPVARVTPDRIVFAAAAPGGGAGSGEVTLTFAGPGALSIGATGSAGFRLTFRATAPVDDDGRWHPGLPSAPVVRCAARGDLTVEVGDDGRTVTCAGSGSVLVGAPADVGVPESSHHDHLRRTAAIWNAWFDRLPDVREDLRPMAAMCWWVLGINTVCLHAHGAPRVVVPSLLGYVALWQWDAYFIAAGLRHGDPELALEQLDVALRTQEPDGQLPDVVHDTGTLASSDDLPPADLATLHRAGSPAAAAGLRVPLTKPPLAAWAVRQVLDAVGDRSTGSRLMRRALASQRWWFDRSDADGDGAPEYAHPYSSGLDDSPVFDRELPVVSPDLLAYLVVQDDLLARWAAAEGDRAVADECAARAERTRELLLDLWDPALRRFVPRSAGGPVPADTAVGLLPLLTGRLPDDVATALRDAVVDPRRYAGQWGVTTVAADDPAFDPDRMWRGPVWMNINALVADGLAASGFAADARRLREAALRGVIRAGGPQEYLDPRTGRRASGAVPCFGWSAALFLDLAVRLTAEPDG